MPLAPGQTLTHYEILGPLGAGGMGEVYRARDTRLDREVAIKVLPESLASDEERLRRFEREAKTLASLNHPNVAGIHGVDHDGETYFLALELVPGEDLAQRIARGPLPVDEALDVCRQIAEGLEAAHEAGVVHRDLKPANVRVTPDGTAKILDFGLAKPIHSKANEQGTTTAESDSFLMTEEGLVLGTPTYMSPEQARGKPVDRRTDIWAFGCVLYECLTGKRAFRGDSLTDVLAAIVEREPDWSALPASTPAATRRLLRRCLDKDPRRRLRDVGEARVTLQEGDVEGDERDARARASRWRTALVFAASLIAGVALTALVFEATRAGDGPTSADAVPGAATARIRRFVEPPVVDDKGRRLLFRETFLSPDGRTLAATSGRGIYVRALDSRESRVIPLDALPRGIAWAPDGEALAYSDGRSIVRVPARGGAGVRLYLEPDEDVVLLDLAWLDDGRLVFAGGRNSDGGILVRAISPGGGRPTEVEAFEELSAGIVVTDLTALPGGRFAAVLFEGLLGEPRQALVAVDASGARTLLELDGMRSTYWVPGGLLLLQAKRASKEQTWAVRVATETLEIRGEPFLLEDVLGGASVSTDGTLAYVDSNEARTSRLAWWSPDGTLESIGREHDRIAGSASYSPRHHAIVYRTGFSMNPRDGGLYRLDLRRGVASELSTGDVWCGGGRTLADGRIAVPSISFEPDGFRTSTFLLPATGRGTLEPWQEGFVEDVTDDLRRALVTEPVRGMQDEFATYVVDLEGGQRSRILSAHTRVDAADISPDGEWLVFEPGPSKPACLTRFPSGEGEWPVSTGTVRQVAFSPDGSRIYYTADNGLYAVELQTEPEIVLGVPELVGSAPPEVELTAQRDADSERFLAIQSEGASESELVVVQDWASRFEGR